MKHSHHLWFLAVAASSSLHAASAHALPPVVAFSSPTIVDEGTDVPISVTVTDPEGAPVTWSWDTNYDMTFDEMTDVTSYTIPGSTLDGPQSFRIGVRATDGVEVRTVYRTITVNNVAPEITSHPLTTAAVRREYRYEVSVAEPAAASDPIEYLLTSRPAGMEIAGNVITWTPTNDQRGRSYSVIVRVSDGDGGDDSQAWTIDVSRNTPPSSPVPISPVMAERVAEGEPVTFLVQNAVDADGDPLEYFFRVSRSSLFTPPDVIGSGALPEGSEGTTSWTTAGPLDPGLWYWQVWVSDGAIETAPQHERVVVGTGELPDAGPIDAGMDRPDAGPIVRGGGDDSGGCSVTTPGSPRASGLAWAFALVLVALARSRPSRRRGRAVPPVACIAIAALVACSSGTDTPGPSDGGFTGVDSDFDGITDEQEGASARTDTDGDGSPDFLDTDSDGDGLPDSIEARDDDFETAPFDSDMDGAADFRDSDADGNGIPDGTEGTGDSDSDGIPDFADLDDDNDLVRDVQELADLLYPPADSDADGLPNFRDPDSDGDGILDGDEWGPDTDGDGLRDFEDADSDRDGIPDAIEAGDADLYSAPVDTDGDMTPDFRDTDSDNDGLADAYEREHGSSPTAEDTDGDGVTDLIEVGAGTDPTDGSVSPRTRGDFVFVVPHEQDPTPDRDTLRFRTSLQLVDLYFLFDISGSMSGEIGALRTAVTTIIGDITCSDFGTPCVSDGDCGSGQACSIRGTCIEDPSASSCVASPWTGGGIYEANLENLLSLQPDPARTSTALGVSTFGATESLNRAAWATADPAGAPGTPVGCDPPMPGRIGCPGFREDAVKLLIAFTDEDSDGTETAAQAGAALSYADITFIGVWSGTTGAVARQALVDLARASGSLSRSGMPLVYDGSDAAVVPAVTAAITEVVRGVPLRVTIASADEPDDAGDALQFIDHLVVNTTNPTCSAVALTEDTDGDGHDDAFPSLLPGTPVCWDVVPLRNETVEPAREPLVFRARLTVYGDGSPLDSRLVYFLVPPVIPPPDIPF